MIPAVKQAINCRFINDIKECSSGLKMSGLKNNGMVALAAWEAET
jgi:hypothetical protein